MKHVFREYDVRGVVDKDLTAEFVSEFGKALATFYRRRKVQAISIGYDARVSSIHFRDLLSKSLLESGINVHIIGLCPTPLVYYSVFKLPIEGGIMITGSHNPPNENGFKICLGKTTIYGEEIQEIYEIMQAKDYHQGKGALVKEENLLEAYITEIKGKIKPGTKPLKVVIDAGNGTGNIIAAKLYRELGFEVIELFSKPDGTFPNHHPDPTMPENLEDLIKTVQKHQGDLGIAFDGDGDRLGVVDCQGRVLWGDQLMIIFGREIIKENPGAKIIGEVKCSQLMYDKIKEFGGTPIMWRVGHSLIKAKMKEEGALLAGEMSGHLFFADRYYGYDDAVYAGVRILELLSQATSPALCEMVDNLPKTFVTPEMRFDCPEEKKFRVVEELAERFAKDYEVITVDGARIIFPEGWGLVRASNTQPVLVIRFEAASSEDLSKIRYRVESVLQELV